MTSTNIRSIILDDIESVSAIEKDSFPNPWEEDVFFQLALSGGRFRIDENIVVFMDVMGEKGAVTGYIVWEEDGSNNHAHILNLAVQKKFRLQ
jgi:ribosomal protein S18 acetylase RimI-like enzyme